MNTSKKIGRYEIIEELGHGAMGTVYRAKDPAMDRVVALKTIISLVLSGDQGDDFRERFFREARAAGGLAHPGIVTVFDVGEHEGLPFLVMEFINGKTLADAVKQGERLTLDRVCEIGQKIAEALAYAHQHGVVHRDIKPANILLTSKESYGIERPKITDFGVAKLAEGQVTLTGQILGTPAFMPPEQFTGAPIDGRADIFSLGVVLYWMATGEQPFPGESMTAVSYKVVHTEPVPPRKLNPSIPAKLDTIIMKCLAKSPDERYQTGDELARELGEARGGSASMQTTSLAGTVAADSDATLVIGTTSPAHVASSTSSQRQLPPSPPASQLKTYLILATVAVLVIGVGSWYGLRNKARPAAAEIASSSAAINSAVPAPAASPIGEELRKDISGTPVHESPPAVSKPPADVKSAGIAPQKPEKVVEPADAPLPPKAEEPSPEPAALDFNPKTLDPKGNAKLKIDADQVPTDLDFTVELNGKLYLRRSAEGNKPQFDDLYVPPGVQEFRVTAKSGAIVKASNTVSTEFKAKKRYTIKIELRTQGMPPGSGVPQRLYSNSQLVLALK